MSYELQRYLSFFGIFLNLFLGLLALTHTRKNPLYRSFFLMCAVLFLWNFSHYSHRSIFLPERVFIVSFQCSLALIPAVLLHFIYRLTTSERKLGPLRVAYAVSVFWCAVCVFTRWIDHTPCFLLYGASLIAIVLWSAGVLAGAFRKCPEGLQRRCEGIVLAGLGGFLLLGILDYGSILLFQTYPFLSILGGLVFSAAVAWAVFTFHLLDLRGSMKRALCTAGVLIAVYLIYLLISGLFEDFPGMRPLAVIIAILGTAFLLSPLGPRRPREVLHRLFFPDKVTLVDVMNRFVSEAERLESVEALSAACLRSITTALPLCSGILYLEGDGGLTVAGYAGGGDPVVLPGKRLAAVVGLIDSCGSVTDIPARVSGLREDLLALPLEKGFFLLRPPRGKGALPGERRFLEIVCMGFSNAHARIRKREEKRPAPEAPMERFGPLIGGSEPMRAVYSTIRRIATADSTVLIRGESGTGKELVARMIHNLSGRSGGPFLAVNCATLTGDLLKSELFGHEKGAFTGAVSLHTGQFEQAHSGTIFLDEIGEIPLATQAVLLRVIEEKEITRLGGQEAIPVDVRVLTATNRDLAREVREGSFREDLFYRLNVIPIAVPPLRERKEDIPLLVDYFIRQFAEEFSKEVKGVSKAALKRLAAHDWPGNIRELSNAIQRAVLLASSEILAPADIALEEIPMESEFSLKSAGEASERETILKALERTGGNVTHAARLLGVSRVTLQKKMKRYDLRGLFR